MFFAIGAKHAKRAKLQILNSISGLQVLQVLHLCPFQIWTIFERLIEETS